MTVTELVTSKLDGLISPDLLQEIQKTVRFHEQLASAKSNGKTVWRLVGTVECVTWLPATSVDEVSDLVTDLIDDPNSVEWRVVNCEGTEFSVDPCGKEGWL